MNSLSGRWYASSSRRNIGAAAFRRSCSRPRLTLCVSEAGESSRAIQSSRRRSRLTRLCGRDWLRLSSRRDSRKLRGGRRRGRLCDMKLSRKAISKLKLTELFRKLGAEDPESWASSQVEEGINQLGRFLFLRQAWREVIGEDDQSWIQANISHSERYPGAPCSGIGPALQRLLDKGADPQDITDVVRVMQYQLLFRLCYLLSDPGDLEPEVQQVAWALAQIDSDSGEIVDLYGALHESVPGTDPTGREMRPRNSSGAEK
jgi:hypothetical protein